MEILIGFLAIIFMLVIIFGPIALIAFIIVKLSSKKNAKKPQYYNQNQYTPYTPIQTQPAIQPEPIVEESKIETYPYEKKLLLTKNEWAFYRDMKKITDKYNLHILSKIRLADLVSVTSGQSQSEYYSAFGKIKSKHIDFALADPSNLAIKLLIELDDSSHNKINSQQRDYFVENVLKKAGYDLLRVHDSYDLEAKVCNMLRINRKYESPAIAGDSD